MSYTSYTSTAKVKDLTGSKKKSFSLVAYSANVRTASYWDGGSISYYSVLNRATGEKFIPKSGVYPTFAGEHEMQPGEIIINTGVSCGKPAFPAIYCRPDEVEETKKFLEVV